MLLASVSVNEMPGVKSLMGVHLRETLHVSNRF